MWTRWSRTSASASKRGPQAIEPRLDATSTKPSLLPEITERSYADRLQFFPAGSRRRRAPRARSRNGRSARPSGSRTVDVTERGSFELARECVQSVSLEAQGRIVGAELDDLDQARGRRNVVAANAELRIERAHELVQQVPGTEAGNAGDQIVAASDECANEARVPLLAACDLVLHVFERFRLRARAFCRSALRSRQ